MLAAFFFYSNFPRLFPLSSSASPSIFPSLPLLFPSPLFFSFFISLFSPLPSFSALFLLSSLSLALARRLLLLVSTGSRLMCHAGECCTAILHVCPSCSVNRNRDAGLRCGGKKRWVGGWENGGGGNGGWGKGAFPWKQSGAMRDAAANSVICKIS